MRTEHLDVVSRINVTSLEGAAEVRSAVALTLTDGPFSASGGVERALAPHTHLV